MQEDKKEEVSAGVAETKVVALFRGKIAKYKGSQKSAYLKGPVDMISVTVSEGVLEDEHAYHDHGGVDRGILHYSTPDIEALREAWPDRETLWEPCAFGENIFTEGAMSTRNVCIGDVYSIGDAVEVEVSMPRFPCWKVDHRHGEGMKDYVNQNARSGWFYRVKQPGDIRIGDTFRLVRRPHPEFTIEYLQSGLYSPESKVRKDTQFLRKVIALDELFEKHWKDEAQKLLEGKRR